MSDSPHIITSEFVFGDHTDFPLSVVRQKDHGTNRVHAHEFHELVVLLSGSGVHLTDHGSYGMATGDVFLVRGAMAHGYADTHDVDLINILFQPGILGLPLQHLRDLPGYHALFDIEPRLRAAGRFQQRLRLSEDQLAEAARRIALLEDELESRQPGYRFAACTHLMGLLGHLSRCYGDSRRPEQRTLMRLGEVLSFMERNLDEEMTVGALAEIAHMSESTLTRRFRKVLGRSPVEHLIRLRIDRAQRLLQDADLAITEVAFACGFSDSNYFSRRFKAETGVSPRAYRRNPSVL